jgi:hypothetical protein
MKKRLKVEVVQNVFRRMIARSAMKASINTPICASNSLSLKGQLQIPSKQELRAYVDAYRAERTAEGDLEAMQETRPPEKAPMQRRRKRSHNV